MNDIKPLELLMSIVESYEEVTFLIARMGVPNDSSFQSVRESCMQLFLKGIYRGIEKSQKIQQLKLSGKTSGIIENIAEGHIEASKKSNFKEEIMREFNKALTKRMENIKNLQRDDIRELILKDEVTSNNILTTVMYKNKDLGNKTGLHDVMRLSELAKVTTKVGIELFTKNAAAIGEKIGTCFAYLYDKLPEKITKQINLKNIVKGQIYTRRIQKFGKYFAEMIGIIANILSANPLKMAVAGFYDGLTEEKSTDTEQDKKQKEKEVLQSIIDDLKSNKPKMLLDELEKKLSAIKLKINTGEEKLKIENIDNRKQLKNTTSDYEEALKILESHSYKKKYNEGTLTMDEIKYPLHKNNLKDMKNYYFPRKEHRKAFEKILKLKPNEKYDQIVEHLQKEKEGIKAKIATLDKERHDLRNDHYAEKLEKETEKLQLKISFLKNAITAAEVTSRTSSYIFVKEKIDDTGRFVKDKVSSIGTSVKNVAKSAKSKANNVLSKIPLNYFKNPTGISKKGPNENLTNHSVNPVILDNHESRDDQINRSVEKILLHEKNALEMDITKSKIEHLKQKNRDKDDNIKLEKLTKLESALEKQKDWRNFISNNIQKQFSDFDIASGATLKRFEKGYNKVGSVRNFAVNNPEDNTFIKGIVSSNIYNTSIVQHPGYQFLKENVTGTGYAQNLTNTVSSTAVGMSVTRADKGIRESEFMKNVVLPSDLNLVSMMDKMRAVSGGIRALMTANAYSISKNTSAAIRRTLSKLSGNERKR